MSYHSGNQNSSSASVGVTAPTSHDLPNRVPWLNSWLLVLLICGGVVVAVDGFTRPPDLEDGSAETPMLQYEASWAGYTLAFISLPLCYLYFSRVGASKWETLLLWFVLNTVANRRDFSYVRVPGVPLFVTDIVLALFLCVFLRRAGLRWLRIGRGWVAPLIGFASVGVLCAVRGWTSHRDVMLVARDFAVVVYVLFLFVGLRVIRTWNAVRRLFIAFGVGSIFTTVGGLAQFLAEPDQRRFIGYGAFALVVFVASLILTTQHYVHAVIGWPLTFLFAIGVLLCNARTLDVGLALALLFIFLFPLSAKRNLATRRVKIVLGTGVVILCIILAVAQTSAGSAFLERTEDELVSGTLNFQDDPNANFRLLAWVEALQRFMSDPVMGEGYGIPFVFELRDTDVRPHNTYLTVLYKMGLVGFLPLAFFLGYFHWRGWRTVRAFRHQKDSAVLYAILVSNLALCQFGMLNLLLESPFFASVFWLSIGVSIRTMQLLRSPSEAGVVD